jgi:FkbM family methyltransferase
MRLPILAGPLRGAWWLPRAGGKLLRILNGSYEPEQTRLFLGHIARGATVLDVGAHVGYYTLLSARLTGAAGRVFAFEPHPRNCGFLRRHVAVNGFDNVTVEQAAVSDVAGKARFEGGTGSGTGHLTDRGGFEVRTLRLDDFCAAHSITPTAIKIDVEGAELHVLRGAARVIDTAQPVIFLSTHGADVHRDCIAWLRGRGYELSPVLGADLDTTSEVLCLPSRS